MNFKDADVGGGGDIRRLMKLELEEFQNFDGLFVLSTTNQQPKKKLWTKKVLSFHFFFVNSQQQQTNERFTLDFCCWNDNDDDDWKSQNWLQFFSLSISCLWLAAAFTNQRKKKHTTTVK